MSESGSVRRVGRTVGFGILGAVLVLLLLTAIGDGRAPAAQVGAADSTLAECTVERVATYPERIHVRCTNEVEPGTGIVYLAASTRDAAHAARLLSVLSTALVAGRSLDVLYDPSTESRPPGCYEHNCRLLVAVEMR
jgi:hypothetical protein